MQITEQLLIARRTLLNLQEELSGYRIYFMGDKFREDTTVQVHEINSRIASLKDQVETALESVTMPFKVQVQARHLKDDDRVYLTEKNPVSGVEETLEFTANFVGNHFVSFVRHEKGKTVRTAERKGTDLVWKIQ